MPILDIQVRFRELGRIRLGIQEDTGKTYKSGKRKGEPIMRPKKLPRFRLTSPWPHLLEAAAEHYGGTVNEWQHDNMAEHELVVDAPALDVLVPPGVEVLSQWYERWTGGGCLNRCDGLRQVLVDQKCRCPADPIERAEKAAKNPPEACKPTTRLRVMLPAVPDLGIWRLESHGFHAAAELSGAAEFVEIATRRGTLVPARLVLHEREGARRPNQPRKRFFVPALSFPAALGETLEAMGYLEGGSSTPVYLPGVQRRPDLDEGGVPALSAGSRDFDPAQPVESAELPEGPPPPVDPGPPPRAGRPPIAPDRPEGVDDLTSEARNTRNRQDPAGSGPSSPAEPEDGRGEPNGGPVPEKATQGVSEPEPEPEVEDDGGRSWSGPELIGIRSRELGLARDDKLDLLEGLVARPVSSAKDLTAQETGAVLRWLDDPPVDPWELIRDVRAERGQDPDEEPEAPIDEGQVDGEPFDPGPSDEVLVPEVIGSPGAETWGAEDWRDECKANRVKVTELGPKIEEIARDLDVDVPRTLASIREAPVELARRLARYIEELGADRKDSSR